MIAFNCKRYIEYFLGGALNTLTKYSASGPMAGYLFQCRLALLRGLYLTRKNPEAIISIEKFDDIAFETDDHVNCLMQAKHNITEKSLSDKSDDVWKTLLIWIEGAKHGVFELSKTTYILITTAQCPHNSAMAKLREEACPLDIDDAYNLLVLAAKDSKSKTTEKARAAFLKMTSTEAKLLLSRIMIIDQHPDLTNVFSEISSELNILAPKNAELAAQYLEGWWLGRVCEHLTGQDTKGIPVYHLILKAHEIGKSLTESSLPINDPSELGMKEYSFEDELRVFVQQMRSVKITDKIVQNATSDFYRAYAQRSRWSRENLILEDELSQYDDKLEDTWRRKFDAEVLIAAPQSETEKIQIGRKLFFWATQESTPLRNVVEKWITAGSYHGLADQDKVRWHPDFNGNIEKTPEMSDNA